MSSNQSTRYKPMFTPLQEARMVEKYLKEGAKIGEIGRTFGCSDHKVRTVLHSAGVDFRNINLDRKNREAMLAQEAQQAALCFHDLVEWFIHRPADDINLGVGA